MTEFNPTPQGPVTQPERQQAEVGQLEPAGFVGALQINLDPRHWRIGYMPTKFNDRKLSDRSARFVKLLRENLRDNNAEMANGRRVESHTDAIVWVLERLAETMPLEKLPT